jgi:regulator of protease activity HflC (stomatin/prohibitin superfamily)
VQTAKAEAQKVLIEAQARAQANKIISQSLTPELVNYNAIQKWNGKLPQVTGGSIPMINPSGK